MRFWRRRGRGDRGATLVEFAVVSPLIFFMLGGMLDIGLTVLGRSVASGAAREGARVGIIHFENADINLPVVSPNNALIKAAVDAKLVGLVKPDTGTYVAVRCLDGGTKAVKACSRAAIRIDYDLLEVTVKWKSISATGGTFTPSNLTDVARMVIVGDAGGGGAACAGSGGTIGFNSTTVSVTEGNSGRTNANLTVTRSGSACVTTVAYKTSPSGTNPATAGTDYTTINSLVTFLAGETSKTITIPVLGDSIPEPNETFQVTLSSAVNGTIGAANPATVTILDDDAVDNAPTLKVGGLKMYDFNSNGRIDRITAEFNDEMASLSTTCGNPSAFTFPTNGPGLSVQSVSVAGMIATVTVNEGTVDTSNTNLTVALAAGCVRDVGGNSATFAAQAPRDRAAPILLTIADSDVKTDGQAEAGDTLTLTFSEPIASVSIPATTNVAMTGGTSGTLAMPGIVVTTALNPKNNSSTYSACTLNFNGSAVAANAAAKTVTVTLGALSAGCTATKGQSSPAMSFAPDSGLKDGADVPNGASPAVPVSATSDNFKLF